ncbi:Cupin 2 conserved barrel domain protein [Hirschia baltica ATCC 49814]|uniref:Cupin 2 conserved barrel domain protein n=2 Tax=Hirschia TaxID=2723 RepID=C6XQI1_HIRBI|nr:cupin domain-containing protein [Hirschia baltica]ACT60480.1 Cupin 2 conserved barrel domain protein [Hirschia baltica ATCC 49814]
MKCLLHTAGIISVALLSQSCTTVTVAANETLPAMVIVDENDVVIDQPPPHGAIGMSTAYRISDVAPKRNMEFRKRSLHVGAQIGEHIISHDEVYYVVSGNGVVISDGEEAALSEGMAAYLYTGANVGIRQVGDEPLMLIISYPLAARKE